MEEKVLKTLDLNKPGWIHSVKIESFEALGVDDQNVEDSKKGLKVRYLAIPFGNDGNSLISRNGVVYSRQSIEETLPLWEGVPVNINHQIDEPGVEGLAVGHVLNGIITDRGLCVEVFIDACEQRLIEKIKSGTARSCSIQIIAGKVSEMQAMDGSVYDFVEIKEPLEISLVNVAGFRGATMETILAEAFKVSEEHSSKNFTNKNIEKFKMEDKIMKKDDESEIKKNDESEKSKSELLNVNKSIENLTTKVEELMAKINTNKEELDEEDNTTVTAPVEDQNSDMEPTLTKVIEILENLVERVEMLEAKLQSAEAKPPMEEKIKKESRKIDGEGDNNVGEQNNNSDNNDNNGSETSEEKPTKTPEADAPVAEKLSKKAVFKEGLNNTETNKKFQEAVTSAFKLRK